MTPSDEAVERRGECHEDMGSDRLLVGQGGDTCGLAPGHEGRCIPTFACAECGAEYLRSHPNEKYCSDHCRNLARVGS